jgi:hypothetical protein
MIATQAVTPDHHASTAAVPLAVTIEATTAPAAVVIAPAIRL